MSVWSLTSLAARRRRTLLVVARVVFAPPDPGRKTETVLQPEPSFRPVHRHDGYLALEDLGLIGDGTTSALVGLDGSIPWLCLPRFDSEPLFCGLLDGAG